MVEISEREVVITGFLEDPFDVQTEVLSPFGCDPRVVAEAVLPRYPEEMESVEDARTRVRGLS